MKNIPYGRQYISSNDIRTVSQALKQDLITTGNYVKKLEKNISRFLNVKHVLTCNSGTSAIQLAFMGISLKKNDIVVMPAINFIAAYNMASLFEAKIFLADVDPSTGQMTPETLLKCINYNKLKKIKAIVTMYLGGYPRDIKEFYKIKKKLKCFLIEDSCHALGARYYHNNKSFNIGSCKHADISTFSLHPLKSITSGEGGLVTTKNKTIFKKMHLCRSHGINKSKLHWKYNILNLGFNLRLSDLNCALAISQLRKITKFINYRKKIYNYYKLELENLKGIKYISSYNINKPSFHLFLLSLNFKKNKNKDDFLSFLLNNKILGQTHYIPIYKHKVFKEKINLSQYQGSEDYYKNTISLPIFFNLSFRQQKKVIEKIKYYIHKYL